MSQPTRTASTVDGQVENDTSNETAGRSDTSEGLSLTGSTNPVSSVSSNLEGSGTSEGQTSNTIPEFVEIPANEVDIVELAGAGRFGSVHRARWRGITVAVKRTLCFDTEAQLLSSLRHRNIIKFYGACTQVPHSFLVTEYAEFGSLSQFLECVNDSAFDRTLYWAQDMACGMRYLHEMGIVHRDLKSLNVLVCPEGEEDLVLKICDFGSSRAIGRDAKTLSSVAGTVAWMAPEMIRGGKVAKPADVWSYGVILWELLTLEVPYGDQESFATMLLVADYGSRLFIPQGCPSKFKDLMEWCMQYEPDQRPTFDKILDRVNAMLEDEGFEAAMSSFQRQKPDWQADMDRVSESLKQLHSSSATLAVKQAEIEQREADLRRRERALQQQLQAQAMAAGQSTPTSIHPLLQTASPSSVAASIANSPLSSTNNVPALAWSVAEVGAWVSVLPHDLGTYADRFRDNHITGKILLQLDHDALKDGLGISSFGHRVALLEAITNIQKATDFPPLPLSPAVNESPLALPDKIASTVVFSYTVDKETQVWQVFVKEQRQADGFIAKVDFVLTRPDRPDNEVVALTKPPFQYGRKVANTKGDTLVVFVFYKSELFRRKTIKRFFEIKSGLGCGQREVATVKLSPKSSFRTHRPDWQPAEAEVEEEGKVPQTDEASSRHSSISASDRRSTKQQQVSGIPFELTTSPRPSNINPHMRLFSFRDRAPALPMTSAWARSNAPGGQSASNLTNTSVPPGSPRFNGLGAVRHGQSTSPGAPPLSDASAWPSLGKPAPQARPASAESAETQSSGTPRSAATSDRFGKSDRADVSGAGRNIEGTVHDPGQTPTAEEEDDDPTDFAVGNVATPRRNSNRHRKRRNQKTKHR